MTGPILWQWDGEAMRPMRRFASTVATLEDGAVYRLTPEELRSMASHRHYFAMIRDYWLNLPESAAMEPWAANPEALRKYALIKTGYANCVVHDCKTDAEARRTALLARSLRLDEFAVVAVKGAQVLIFTAQSQAVKAMGRKTFQKSKDDVLGFLSEMVGGESSGEAA